MAFINPTISPRSYKGLYWCPYKRHYKSWGLTKAYSMNTTIGPLKKKKINQK